MATTPTTMDQPARVAPIRRLWWVVLLTIGAASVANIAVYFVATALFEGPRQFAVLAPASIIASTTTFLLIAAVVYLALGRISARPVQLFRTLGYIVMVLSFLMPVAAGATMPAGPDAVTVAVLIVMHLVAGLITIRLFTTLGAE